MEKIINRMLVVEDEEALLFGFRRLFRTPEMEIDTAGTFAEAQSLILKNVYKLVVTDLRLGGSDIMEGFEVIRAAKEAHPETVVIAMTAFGDVALRDKVLGLGADYYFEKPISPKLIKEVLAARER
jgi:DNA-binding response OmpR family regulator